MMTVQNSPRTVFFMYAFQVPRATKVGKSYQIADNDTGKGGDGDCEVTPYEMIFSAVYYPLVENMGIRWVFAWYMPGIPLDNRVKVG